MMLYIPFLKMMKTQAKWGLQTHPLSQFLYGIILQIKSPMHPALRLHCVCHALQFIEVSRAVEGRMRKDNLSVGWQGPGP